MGFNEIFMALNTNINKPLDTLITEQANRVYTPANNAYSKANSIYNIVNDNNYGNSAIKLAINNISLIKWIAYTSGNIASNISNPPTKLELGYTITDATKLAVVYNQPLGADSGGNYNFGWTATTGDSFLKITVVRGSFDLMVIQYA